MPLLTSPNMENQGPRAPGCSGNGDSLVRPSIRSPPTAKCVAGPLGDLPWAGPHYGLRDDTAPSLFCRCSHLLLLTLLLCLRLDLSHPKAVKGVADDHLARLAALHNVMDLPADNLAAGEKV